jgi:MarR family transcriptional regulator, transcriptional regulator for hemolysin
MDLGLLLSQASHGLNVEMTARLQELDITPRAYCVLRTALEQPMSQGEIATACDLDKTTMVVTIDQLELAGWARRVSCPQDRRTRLIEVTPAGRKIVARAGKVVDAAQADLLAGLAPEQRDALVAALQTVVAGSQSASAMCDRAPRRRAAA